MTDPRPTPMDRAPYDPTAPLLGPGQWHCEPPSFRKGEVPAHVALIMDGNGRWANSRGLARTEGIGRESMRSWTLSRAPSMRACAT